jgi:hypothetical protein
MELNNYEKIVLNTIWVFRYSFLHYPAIHAAHFPCSVILNYVTENKIFFEFLHKECLELSGFGGLGVACCPLVPKFGGSSPGEGFGFLRAKKFSARLPSEGK